MNRLSISRWLMGQGMGFAHASKWWAEGQRPTPHNGIDLYKYIDPSGAAHTLKPGAIVPVLLPGRAIATVPDFIGTSVFIMHDTLGMMSAFGHIIPAEGVMAGAVLAPEAIVGVIAPKAAGSCPAHLHISIAEVPDGLPEWAEITWEALEGSSAVKFLDPEGYLY